ncbi:hypothetical protein [Paenibacillus aquistagni]|uniref:hypothetical protein n=1 Tax=Paenibacillus aquistagni TaxID=1852522 RepID=UPI0014833C41|nr:hypothetical protein [Paenibacillus aquistagni]
MDGEPIGEAVHDITQTSNRDKDIQGITNRIPNSAKPFFLTIDSLKSHLLVHTSGGDKT